MFFLRDFCVMHMIISRGEIDFEVDFDVYFEADSYINYEKVFFNSLNDRCQKSGKLTNIVDAIIAWLCIRFGRRLESSGRKDPEGSVSGDSRQLQGRWTAKRIAFST